MRLLWLVTVGGLAGCATTPSGVTSTPAHEEPVADTAKAGSNDELARAFTEADADPASSEKPRVTVAEAPRPVDRRGPFRAAKEATLAAQRAKKLDAARIAAKQAVDSAQPLHGQERDQAGQLAFAVEFDAKDLPRAQAAALAWRRSCGPEELEACRAHALAALAKVAAPLEHRLRKADYCVAMNSVACLSYDVDSVASATQDEVLAGRAALVRALAEKNENKKLIALERVEKNCSAPGCLSVRHRALQVATSMALASRDYGAAARSLILDGIVNASAVEPELRPWVRAKELDEVCVKLDASAGAGTCRRLEKDLAGSWSFKDFSKDKGTSSGLSSDQVKLVNQHYAPLLQECLAEQARRLVPPDAQEFEVQWVVSNDGHVRDAHLRQDLDAMPFADCLRKQFSFWRYPRFEGELQHVQQRFTVTASTRTSMR